VTVAPGAIAAITVAGTFNLTPTDPNTGSEDIALSSGTFSIGAGATIGSLSGDTGTVNLGANQLTIGTRNQNTTYSGVIQGTGGSLNLTGGTLALSNTNTYTGGTTVNSGTLYVTSGSSTASGTGSGNVVVNSGATVGGFGMIGGNLTVNSGATLSPAVFSTRQITIGGALSLSGTLSIQLSNGVGIFSDKVELDNGATIDPVNATLSLSLVSGFTPMPGEQFVIMENTKLDEPNHRSVFQRSGCH
jgi:fibronectin-binding autotransporter adhesin